jgi:hypothetical protein
MTEKEAIIILIEYNDWRRGDEIPQPNPTIVGNAIDKVIQEWKDRNQFVEANKMINNNTR